MEKTLWGYDRTKAPQDVLTKIPEPARSEVAELYRSRGGKFSRKWLDAGRRLLAQAVFEIESEIENTTRANGVKRRIVSVDKLREQRQRLEDELSVTEPGKEGREVYEMNMRLYRLRKARGL